MDDKERDLVDLLRRKEAIRINSDPSEREGLEQKYGKVWSTEELQKEFTVEGFAAPYVVVVRKTDQKKGSLSFQHYPRYYFDFIPHEK